MPAAALTDDDAAVQVLRTGCAIGILFLLVYLFYDARTESGGESSMRFYHWASVAGGLLFFAATWTQGFLRFWKLWSLLFCIGLVSIFILISGQTREADSRFIAVLLFPIVAAAFLNWGWRWQVALGLCCIALYAIAQAVVPIPGANSVYRWFGLIAGVMLAESSSVFIGAYRQRLRAEVEQLNKTAAFRESQIATMAHDIRSPVAALAGFVDLLEDDQLSDEDRRTILGRIGSTAWSMDLTVSNVLDVYQIESGHIASSPIRIDPNRIVADAASNCAAQAVRKGLRLTVDYGEIPRGGFDPRHLERVARNLLAYFISRLSSGEVWLTTAARKDGIAIEVDDGGPPPSAEELANLFKRPGPTTDRRGFAALGLYLACRLTESAGGRVQATRSQRGGLKLVAELPSAQLEAKPPGA